MSTTSQTTSSTASLHRGIALLLAAGLVLLLSVPGPAAGAASPFLLTRLVVGSLQSNCYLLWHRETLDLVIIDPGAGAAQIAKGVRETGATPQAILLTHGHDDHLGAAEELSRLFGCPIYGHAADHAMMRTNGLPTVKAMNDGEELRFGEIALTVLHVPGHSPGGVGYLLAMAPPAQKAASASAAAASDADDGDDTPSSPAGNSGDSFGIASEPSDQAVRAYADGEPPSKTGGFLFSGDILFAEGIGRTWRDGDEKILLEGIRRQFGELSPTTMVLPGHGPPAPLGKIRTSWLDRVLAHELGD